MTTPPAAPTARTVNEYLELIADQASRATLVQDRSVGLIKQTCAAIASEAREALEALAHRPAPDSEYAARDQLVAMSAKLEVAKHMCAICNEQLTELRAELSRTRDALAASEQHAEETNEKLSACHDVLGEEIMLTGALQEQLTRTTNALAASEQHAQELETVLAEMRDANEILGDALTQTRKAVEALTAMAKG